MKFAVKTLAVNRWNLLPSRLRRFLRMCVHNWKNVVFLIMVASAALAQNLAGDRIPDNWAALIYVFVFFGALNGAWQNARSRSNGEGPA